MRAYVFAVIGLVIMVEQNSVLFYLFGATCVKLCFVSTGQVLLLLIGVKVIFYTKKIILIDNCLFSGKVVSAYLM